MADSPVTMLAPRVEVAISSRAHEERKVAVWQAWRTFFETSARAQDEIDSVLREGAGVSLADYNVLVLLQEAKDRQLRFKELAHRMSFSKSRLSYQVKTLEKRGLICRQAVEGDARGLFVQLTDEGLQTFLQAGAIHARHIESLMLSDLALEEAQVIQRVFARVASRLQNSSYPGDGEACSTAQSGT